MLALLFSGRLAMAAGTVEIYGLASESGAPKRRLARRRRQLQKIGVNGKPAAGGMHRKQG
jgi:hypothetical protein